MKHLSMCPKAFRTLTCTPQVAQWTVDSSLSPSDCCKGEGRGGEGRGGEGRERRGRKGESEGVTGERIVRLVCTHSLPLYQHLLTSSLTNTFLTSSLDDSGWWELFFAMNSSSSLDWLSSSARVSEILC